ncbi:hypothetical protein [Streptomyces sp. CRN 30]|uniref:hypothetical protein n=1 Tax=Streptomyces sp. CRN 30 TaxID=3075613 RepID=UPI002A80C7F0|nr:hypothetical protein [Streptomyces sp. CRN 30]
MPSAILNGLPPLIPHGLRGPRSLDPTTGYKAIYPAENIESHRAFIARRRTGRPSEECRTPSEEEQDAFLAFFENRKASTGTCGRAFPTLSVHEHACAFAARFSGWPRHGRLEEIRGNLVTRVARPSSKADSEKSKHSG